jgi:hypothetical protein
MVLQYRIASFFLLVIWLSACVPSAVNTEQPVADELIISPATQTPIRQQYYPLDTRTGMYEVDRILSAIELDDLQKLRDLLGFVTVPCTKAEGLGGPPKCLENEVEGVLVDVLPFLESEGSFLRKADIQDWQGIDVSHLYAVYRVAESAYSEEYCPAGEYAIMFVAPDNMTGVVLQIREAKIIRIDYVFDPPSRTAILQKDASELILAPILQN